MPKKVLRTLTSTFLVLMMPVVMAIIIYGAINQDVNIYPLEQAVLAILGISVSMLCLWLID